MELANRRFARARVGTLASLFVLIGSQFCACSDDDLDFTQEENATCQDCQECSDIVASCLCDTCISWATDPDTNSLLFCERGIWRKRASCPGGASVGCTDGDAHWLKCLDENGNEIDF
jgi:hypothetical protein